VTWRYSGDTSNLWQKRFAVVVQPGSSDAVRRGCPFTGPDSSRDPLLVIDGVGTHPLRCEKSSSETSDSHRRLNV
jgi:hypothetical protein